MIVIDTKIGQGELVKCPPLNNPDVVYRAPVKECDIYFHGCGPTDQGLSIGIELKSISDLISSAWNGRLQSEQVPKLKKYDRPFVLTYGDVHCDPHAYLQYRPRMSSRYYPVRTNGHRGNPVKYYYYTAIQTELEELGVRYRHVDSVETAAFWIGCLYEWFQRDYSSHKLFKTLGRYTDLSKAQFDSATENILCPTDLLSKDQELIAQVANKLPGLGFKRALAAALYFPSIWAMMAAEPSEWAEIPIPPGNRRIGLRTGARVHRAIRKQARRLIKKS